MHRLSRSTALKIAATIMILLSLVDIIVYQIPSMIDGASVLTTAVNDRPPFFMVIISFALDVITLVAACGAWFQQRWGVVLLIITATLGALPSLAGMLFSPNLPTEIAAGIAIVLSAGVIVLCLWRDRRPAANGVTTPVVK